MENSITWANEKRKLSQLIPWKRNPRQIKGAEVTRLQESLVEFGQVEPTAIGPDNEVYNGHQRLKSWAAKFGDIEIDVRVSSRALSEKEREKLTVYLHKGAAGEWDFDTLANEFELDDLLEWGFDKKELDLDLWAGEPDEDPGAQIDRAEELREKWGVELGQMWKLGEHRIICGDCRNVKDKLLQGDIINLIQIDPPYGVDYSGQKDTMFYGHDIVGKPREKIEGDNSIIDAMELLDNTLAVYTAPIVFVWLAPQFYYDTQKIIDANNLKTFAVIVWNKNHANFGAMGATYKPKFELALACKVDKIPFYGPDNETTVWDIDRSSKNEFHPTQKPIELFERAIKNHTQRGDIVADFFCGGGTSIVACERLRRKCRAVEISPAYVAVAIDRWATMTGGTPELLP